MCVDMQNLFEPPRSTAIRDRFALTVVVVLLKRFKYSLSRQHPRFMTLSHLAHSTDLDLYCAYLDMGTASWKGTILCRTMKKVWAGIGQDLCMHSGRSCCRHNIIVHVSFQKQIQIDAIRPEGMDFRGRAVWDTTLDLWQHVH